MSKITYCIMLAILWIANIGDLYATKKTKINATIVGYNGKEIFFDFIEQSGINESYPYQEGMEYMLEVELKDITMLKINSWIWICLQPGDALNIHIEYNGRNYKNATFSGNKEAVLINNTIRDMRNIRVENHYKQNPMAAIVTQVKSKDYCEASQKELEQELTILKKIENKIPKKVYNYLLSEHEGILLSNLLSYPHMVGAATEADKAQLFPENYWNLLDNYTIRRDKGSLRSTAYCSFLLPYKAYVVEREARKRGDLPKSGLSLREEYDELVSFYDNPLREKALFVFLFNVIRTGKNFDEVEILTKEFLKDHATDKELKNILTQMMQ